jgi:hypothetical protein
MVDAQCTVLASSTDIVVAIRGSEGNLVDWVMTNLDMFDFTSPVLFPPDAFKVKNKASMQVWLFNSATKVHPGFYEAMRALLPDVTASISAACRLNAQASNVWFTGHSMGGALAILMAAYLQDSNFIAPVGSTKKPTHGCTTNLNIAGVFGLENPKVGNADFARHYAKIGLASRTLVYMYGGDPVPMIPTSPYTHVGFRVHMRRSLANPDITILDGPTPAQTPAPGGVSDVRAGDHTARYWLTVLRNLATTTCQAAAARRSITFVCPDFAKLTAVVVAPTVEVAEMSGVVYYLDNAGRRQIPPGKVSVTCYDDDTPPPGSMALTVGDDREPMCTADAVNGEFVCRYHRKTRVMSIFGPWDVMSLTASASRPVDTSEAQSWPDIQCDIKSQAFLTGTVTGTLVTNHKYEEYITGFIKLNADRSKSCALDTCLPSTDLRTTKPPADKLSFADSLTNHACCYCTCGTSQCKCDDELLANMYWQCYQLQTAPDRLRCRVSAQVAWNAARSGSAHMTAQIKSFCPGPGAATAAISGRILFFDGAQISPLVGAVVACYDVDVGLSNELMCMAKSDGAGAFSCYYYTKLNDDRWDSGPMQYDDRWDSGPMQYDDRWDSGPMHS